MVGAHAPPLRAAAHEDARQAAEEDGVRAGGGEGEAHPAGGLGDAGGDLQEPSRIVVNSALAERTLGMASRTARTSQ